MMSNKKEPNNLLRNQNFNEMIGKKKVMKPIINTSKYVDLFEKESINEKINVLGEFIMNETSLYLFNEQITLLINSDVFVDSIQYGVCLENQSDMAECYNSKYFNCDITQGTVLCENLCSMKNFIKDEKYIIWIQIECVGIENISFQKEYSNCILKKI